MIMFIIGAVFGVLLGITLVALVSVNRFEEDDDETDSKADD